MANNNILHLGSPNKFFNYYQKSGGGQGFEMTPKPKLAQMESELIASCLKTVCVHVFMSRYIHLQTTTRQRRWLARSMTGSQ